jgi:hypothetical protein
LDKGAGRQCALDHARGQIGNAKASYRGIDQDGLAVCREFDLRMRCCFCAVAVAQVPFDQIAPDSERRNARKVLRCLESGICG